MSEMELYEQSRGREALKIKKYCEDMPVWKGLAKSALAGILLYIFILTMAVLAFADWFEMIHQRMGSALTAVAAAVSLGIFAALYSAVADAVIRERYRKIRSSMFGYRSDIRRFERIRREQENNESAD
ncbi:MAG: hypothetical protein HUJ76_01925 [Parasporobacterium sp.]|nr:hypothetical protein [Parasporobacterium sp.]